MIEDIFEKNTKYKYLVSYPNGEYQKNHIGLDFYNKRYTSQSIVGKGIIIDIQHYGLNIHDDSEVLFEFFLWTFLLNHDCHQASRG